MIKKKNSQYEKLLSEIQNYLNFVKVGNFSKAVSEALKEAERKSDNLKEEIKSLEFQKENSFKSPPKEWIDHRLERLHEILSKNTVSSTLALKEVLGTIQLEPISDEESDFYYIISNGEKKFKPYYVAHTKIQTLALLDDRYKSSNWLQWRRGRDSFSPVVPLLLRSRPPSLSFALLTPPPLEALGSASNPTFFSLCFFSHDIRHTKYDMRFMAEREGFEPSGKF